MINEASNSPYPPHFCLLLFLYVSHALIFYLDARRLRFLFWGVGSSGVFFFFLPDSSGICLILALQLFKIHRIEFRNFRFVTYVHIVHTD